MRLKLVSLLCVAIVIFGMGISRLISSSVVFSLHLPSSEQNLEALVAEGSSSQKSLEEPKREHTDASLDKEYEEIFSDILVNDTFLDEGSLFEDEKIDQMQLPTISKDLYRINIGDSFYVYVYGEPNTGRTVTVDFTGSIYYFSMDPIFVRGTTFEEFRSILNERVNKLFKFGSVAIVPLQFGGQYYTILGEVGGAGKKVLQGKTTVLTAICDAGGLRSGGFRGQTIDFADLNHTFLARHGDYVPVDFSRLIIDGDMSQDIPLESGDYIFVPSALNREIYVTGEVGVSTSIGYLHTITLVEALAEARGINSTASSRIIIIRGSLVNPIQFQVDIRRILRGYEPNFILQPGDIIYVPPRRFQTLKDLGELAVSSFVTSATSNFGSRAWQEFDREASSAHMQLEADRDARKAARRAERAAEEQQEEAEEHK
jgi:polysaccharide biosynthesis/export protein